jgi:leukotriene-A4 hydrolase
LFGAEYFGLASALGLSHLQADIDNFGADSPFTRLVLSIDGGDPDESYSSVPYEKGCLFLVYLKKTLAVSDQQFDKFLGAYLTAHAYKCIVTDDFVAFFKSFFSENENLPKVEWDLWLHQAGMPKWDPGFNVALIDSAKAAAHAFLKSSDAAEVPKSLNVRQQILLLEELEAAQSAVTSAHLMSLDAALHLSSSKNCEILFAWIRLRSDAAVLNNEAG